MRDPGRCPRAFMLAAGLVLATVACRGDEGEATTMDSAGGAVATATPGTGATVTDSTMMDANASAMISLLTTVDQAEIEGGQLAVSKGQHERVRDYARKMIEEHAEARRRLSELGAARGRVPSSGTGTVASASGTGTTGTRGSGGTGGDTGRIATSGQGRTGTGATGSTGRMAVGPDSVTQLLNTHRRTMGELRGMTGTAFDRAYIDCRIAAHQRVLGMLHASSSSVMNGELAGYVRDMAERVQDHLEEAQEIQREITREITRGR